MNSSRSQIGEENNGMYQVAGLTCSDDSDTHAVVGGTPIYDNGEYLVENTWTVGCAAEVGASNMDIPEGLEIIASNTDMAFWRCRFLAEGEYTIYPDEGSPAGRVLPAA